MAPRSFVFLSELKLDSDVDDSNKKDSKIKVRVSRVCNVYNPSAKKGEKELLYVSMVLLDEEGGYTYATIPIYLCEKFSSKIIDGKIHIIKRFEVLPNKTQYRVVSDSKIMIKFLFNTYIKAIENEEPMIPKHRFDFLKFDNIDSRRDNHYILTDLFGVVVKEIDKDNYFAIEIEDGRRKQCRCIGRMSYVHPTAGERYYLRLLLNIVKGSRSYEEIRTINGQLYPTFKDACYALGLLNNDKEWNDAMREANQWAMPHQLRDLFVTMLLFCEVTDVNNLWETNYYMLSEDIERKKRKLFGYPDLQLSESATKTYTLIEIDKILMKYEKRLKDIKNMPQPNDSEVEGMENKLIMEEKMYDKKQLHNEWSTKIKQLNPEQLEVYNAVIDAVNKNEGDAIFVYGHGGTGKTFLYGTISAKIRAENKIVLNVAPSGIAALLLPGGRTAHSRFEIPIDLFDDSTCNVKQKTQLAELLQQTSLIIWDEAPMDHRFAFEALDRTLRDIVGSKNPDASTKLFGGKTVLLGGDFRQVLPIVPKGARQDIVQASINRSYIWKSCKVFLLKTSMRVREEQSDGEKRKTYQNFNEWLLAMGDGRLETKAETKENEPTWIKIPEEYVYSTGKLDIRKVVDEIYPNFITNSQIDEYLRDRAILTPLNENADTINDYMIDLMPGDYKVYKSCDEICQSSLDSEDQFTAYPTEYLNTLHIQGLPNHELKLKVGMPVMLLRNINPSKGLCNDTRLIITRTGNFLVEARIITGSQQGKQVLIPRIMMTSSDTKLPFILKRRQYPLKPCYAMTINKSQGQSLTTVGVYLPKPVFSHGQLYVAASRTTSPQGLKFFIDDSNQEYKGHTRNIVYKEVFSNLPMLS